MIVLTVATALLAVVALVAAYFVARASIAIVDMRRTLLEMQEQATSLRKQGKDVMKQALRTERTANRIMDKLYQQHKDTEQILKPLLSDEEVRRAIRKATSRSEKR